jgi:protein SCO1/2
MRVFSRILVLMLAFVGAGSVPARADEAPGTMLQQVGFDQNLDAQLPLDLTFRDELGRTVRLGDFFGKKPVILTLVYYRCPVICGEELKGLARSLKPLSLSVGDQFEVVTVSIDPSETPELARQKKASTLERYGHPGAENGWHFLTGDQASIAALAKTVGFRYTYSNASQQFIHAAGLTIATANGRLSRYFYGIDYPPKDLQFGLMESSAGKIGSPIARLLLFCYHYDPTTGKYSLAIVTVLRVFGTATALILAAYVAFMIRRDRTRGRRAALFPATQPTPN